MAKDGKLERKVYEKSSTSCRSSSEANAPCLAAADAAPSRRRRHRIDAGGL